MLQLGPSLQFIDQGSDCGSPPLSFMCSLVKVPSRGLDDLIHSLLQALETTERKRILVQRKKCLGVDRQCLLLVVCLVRQGQLDCLLCNETKDINKRTLSVAGMQP